MPFYLYHVKDKAGYRQYEQIKKISLAGKNGPLRAIAFPKDHKRPSPCPWQASADKIVSAESKDSCGNAIIIDLKPSATEIVSLYRLLHVWGFTYEKWTPIALLLQELHADKKESDPEEFKRSFNDKTASNALAGEFLYLNGGSKSGNWTWGRVGSVNGALLYRDAFKYLAGELQKHLCGEDILKSC